MSYVDTFIRVAEDCPVDAGIVPAARGERKSIAAIQHELLTDRPYRYTHEDLIFEVHIRHKAIPQDVLKAQGDAIRAELFRKNHPCMRASPLPKTHGWGVHFDGNGRMAIYAVGSEEYRRLGMDSTLKVIKAVRSKRG
jgi:hypothetical protein